MKKAIFFLYFLFLLLFSFFSYVFIDPNLLYLKAIYSGFPFHNRVFTASLYTLYIFIFFTFYGLFLWLGIKKKIKTKDIYLMLSITVGSLLFSYPAMLSYDIFNYVLTSKVLFFFHENPYVIMPIEFIGNPLLPFTHAANKIALYGPFWIISTGIPYILGFENFIVTLFNFKLFIAIFYLATIFLVWKVSKNIISVILLGFNPLILIETLISGHNDIVMIFFTMLSFFLLTKKKVFYAILFFILSILIKYATILLIPILLYIFWKTYKKEEINWKNIFYFSSLLMLAGFFLSPIREEIYPWYAIWFLPFIFLAPNNKFLINISVIFSFSLLLRYTPYMLTGTYAGQTPAIKELISFVPSVIYCIYYVFKKKI